MEIEGFVAPKTNIVKLTFIGVEIGTTADSIEYVLELLGRENNQTVATIIVLRVIREQLLEEPNKPNHGDK